MALYDLAEMPDLDLDDFNEDHLSYNHIENRNHAYNHNHQPESQLCIPQDRIEDLEFFPNFTDDSISLEGLFSSPEHTNNPFDNSVIKDLGTLEPQQAPRDTLEGQETLASKGLETFPPSENLKHKGAQNKGENEAIALEGLENFPPFNIRKRKIRKGNEEGLVTFLPWPCENLALKETQDKEENKAWIEDFFKVGIYALGPKKPRSKRQNRYSLSSFSSLNDNVKRVKRRCSHCEVESTPQWRTGPLGPKTLCNACGVRYKSGRLLPEYRPAASPTFDSLKHSNFHKRILKKKIGIE